MHSRCGSIGAVLRALILSSFLIWDFWTSHPLKMSYMPPSRATVVEAPHNLSSFHVSRCAELNWFSCYAFSCSVFWCDQIHLEGHSENLSRDCLRERLHTYVMRMHETHTHNGPFLLVLLSLSSSCLVLTIGGYLFLARIIRFLFRCLPPLCKGRHLFWLRCTFSLDV